MTLTEEQKRQIAEKHLNYKILGWGLMADDEDVAAAITEALELAEKGNADFAVADEERELRHREQVAKLEAEVDELRLQNKILSANREADEKDIVELKAEVNRLKGEQP